MKAALISGAASGMGEATVQRLAADGWSVAIADINEVAAGQVAARLRAGGADAFAVVCDVARPADCEQAVAHAVARFGRIDALVNAAGVWLEGAADTVTEAQWDRVLDINLKGTFFLCRHAIPYLERQAGVIVNIASDAGLVGNSGAAVYCASKGGVVLLTRALALELAPRGVRAVAVCPADVDTPMLRGQARDHGGGDETRYMENLRRKYPQGQRARFITPQQVADLIAYLLSDSAAAITGSAIPFDYGITAGY
jgi:NAD(P)-dependent dehydrogenase (short-subunit alcohol dehydrogenase family)